MLTVEFVEPLPGELPQEVQVFSLERARADWDDVLDVLGRLDLLMGLDTFRWTKGGGWITADRPDARVAMNEQSGALRFWTRLDRWEAATPAFSIDEAQLADIAKRFLMKTELADEPVDKLSVRKITYLQMQADSIDGESSAPIVLEAGVIFGREIGGVPVSGPGGLLMINIAADESVIGGTKVWRRVGPAIRTATVVQADRAINELHRRLRRQKIDEPVQVKAEFCYFERGENDEQSVLEPAYAFIYEHQSAEHRFTRKSVEVIPAISESRQDWHPRKRYATGNPG